MNARLRQDIVRVDPAALLMAFEYLLQQAHTMQPVGECRVFDCRRRIRDLPVEPPEYLLVSIVVAFAMAAGEIGVRRGRRVQQRRIFNDDLVRRIAMADPELIRPLLVPRHAALSAEDLDLEPVLAAGGHLADSEGAARAVAQMDQDGAEVFGIDRYFVVVFRPQRLAGECFDGLLRLFASLMEDLQIGAKRGDLWPVRCWAISIQCEPMSPTTRSGPLAAFSMRQL